MKNMMAKFGAALMLTTVLAGCQADNTAYNRPATPRDVNYRTGDRNPNATSPAVPNNTDLNNTGDQVNNANVTDQAKLAKKIADRAASVDGVKEAHVLVTGNNVAIGVIPDKGQKDLANLRKKTRLDVLPLVGKRQVLVSTDNRYVKRITNAETAFNAGKATQEVRSDIVGIINDLSNALKRPFENNSK